MVVRMLLRPAVAPARVLKLLLEDTISMMGVSVVEVEEMSETLDMEMEQVENPS